MSDGGGPFGFDITVALLIDEVISECRPEAIVETGCHMGDTTSYLAEVYPGLPIFSCHIEPAYSGFTRYRTREAPNVFVECRDSPALITDVSERYSPRFSVLMHIGGEQWPLVPELTAIQCGIAVIHDFDIDHPRFSYDEYNGVRCGPRLLAEIPDFPDAYYTPDPNSDYPLPCLQVGRRAGVGIVPIGVDPQPLDENPHLIRHSLNALRAETAAS